MQQPVIYIIESPTDSCWQIGKNLDQVQHLLLIGWQADVVKGGVPQTVSNIISQTLCKIATCSFPTSESISNLKKYAPNAPFNYSPIISGFAGFLRKFYPSPPPILVSTSDAKLATRLFDAPLFSWELQSTLVLLSDHKKASPKLNLSTFKKLINNEKSLSEMQKIAHEKNIIAVLKPATDGEAAAVLFLSEDIKKTFLSVLKSIVIKYHFEVQFVSEDVFKNI